MTQTDAPLRRPIRTSPHSIRCPRPALKYYSPCYAGLNTASDLEPCDLDSVP
ncbi:hypothetical protein BN159_p79 (plasmid) [Streptomyces davaonensis JCM 4913]|uniref:Uncharacterized protein n=1 Tax=Streptomyces davaonensis (strain DSM 101723 / JCM 4913 / KCC S-0913 / 768) TaxID=1214101 RepID=K4RH41_STRDJ|nr:hypothetical protein BN159_p79 [Streptomyces davaonensis JCM 4913]